MATRLRKPEPRQRWAWLVVALAGVAGLWFGYDFGRQVSAAAPHGRKAQGSPRWRPTCRFACCVR